MNNNDNDNDNNDDDQSVDTNSHVIAVVGRPEAAYMLLLTAPEADSLRATGQILRAEHARDGMVSCSLNTNDALSDLWMSNDEGNLWTVGANGHVWTTATTTGVTAWCQQNPLRPGFVLEDHDDTLTWSGGSLPDLAVAGYRPNATRVWGTTDTDVRVSTFEGPDFHWDGTCWTEECNAEPQRHQEDPVVFDRVVALLAASGGGKVYDVRRFDGHTLVAAGPRGVLELVGGNNDDDDDPPQLQPFNATIQCVRLCPMEGKLVVIEPAPSEPSYIEYDPEGTPQWVRVPV